MTKRLLIALLALTMTAHISGCSSSGSRDDSESAAANDDSFAEEGEGDFADDTAKTAEAEPAAEGSEEPSAEPSAEGDTKVAEEAAPEDTGGDLSLGDETPADQTQTAQVEEPAAPADDLSLDEPAAGTTENQDVAANAAPPTDEPLFTSDPPTLDGVPAENTTASTASTDVAPQAEPEAASKPAYSGPAVYAPLLKVKDAAYTAADGTTLNRVYLARPKDTPRSVATKIYGASTRSKDLVKWNPILKRGMRTGDKVYYSSPTNASDQRMITYYEDIGAAPQTYVSKEGDNIRTVSTSLLGFKDAWKEVWSTNANVESRGNIPAGLEIKYWNDVAASAPTQALAQTGAPPANGAGAGVPTTLPPAGALPETAMPPTDQAGLGNNADPLAPPPPSDLAANDPLAPPTDINQPPPPMPEGAAAQPPPQAAAGSVAPPPTTDPLAAPPVPPPQAAAEKPPEAPAAATMEEGGMDPDTTMAIGVGGILLLAAAVIFVMIRKNRSKRMEMGQTQV